MRNTFHPLVSLLNGHSETRGAQREGACVRVKEGEEEGVALETKSPRDELIKHLFSGFQPRTLTRLARTTGRAGMNLGDKGARVYLRLTLGLRRADKRTAWKQLWSPLKGGRQPVCISVGEAEEEKERENFSAEKKQEEAKKKQGNES